MDKIVQVSVGVGNVSSREARRILAVAGSPDAKAGPIYYFKLVDGSLELENLRGVLRDSAVNWWEQVDYTYTESELSAAPLIYPELRRPETGDGGTSYGTKFDLSDACPVCGTGARQIGPLRLKASEIPRTGQLFQTLDHEYLFAPQACEHLASFSGIELRQTVDADTEESLPWFQLIATHVLPPMSKATTGLKSTVGCKECRRDGYFHKSREPLLITYDDAQIDLEKIPDAALTFEHFGWSGLREPLAESHFASPLLLIKPAVIAALRAARVRLLQFYPVAVR